MFKTIVKLYKTWIKQYFCDHTDCAGHSTFKMIAYPIDFNAKKSDCIKQGIIPNMLLKCKKCKKFKSIFE